SDILFRPHDECIAAREQQQAHDGQRAPVSSARQGIAERAGDDEQEQSGYEESETRKQKRRQVRDADLDREVGRAPEDADDQIGDERLALESSHQSGSVGMKPGFSNSVDSTIVVRVFICEFGPRKSRRMAWTPSRSGATTLRM